VLLARLAAKNAEICHKKWFFCGGQKSLEHFSPETQSPQSYFFTRFSLHLGDFA
jgi:hypothetical protein